MRYLILLLLCFPLFVFGQEVPADGQTHAFSRIFGVQAAHIYQVEITQGREATVRIESTDDIRSEIRASVRGSELILSMSDAMNFRNYQNERIRVYVTLPHLEELKASGAASVDVEDMEQSEKMMVQVSGAARVDISGRATAADINVSGAGKLDAKRLEVQQCKAKVSGAGHASIKATETIVGRVNGAGSLRYGGNPRERDVDVSGAGSARSM